MKASELRQKKPAELQEMLLALHKEQFNLRMQKGSGQLSKPSRVKAARKEVAQIKTILTEMAAGKNS